MKHSAATLCVISVLGLFPFTDVTASNQRGFEEHVGACHPRDTDLTSQLQGKRYSLSQPLAFMLKPNGQDLWIEAKSFHPESHQVMYSINNQPWRPIDLKARLLFRGFNLTVVSLDKLATTRTPIKLQVRSPIRSSCDSTVVHEPVHLEVRATQKASMVRPRRRN